MLLVGLRCFCVLCEAASSVRPKVSKTTHYCEATKKFKVALYRDSTSVDGNVCMVCECVYVCVIVVTTTMVVVVVVCVCVLV